MIPNWSFTEGYDLVKNEIARSERKIIERWLTQVADAEISIRVSTRQQVGL